MARTVRTRASSSVKQRYHVDTEQASRVEATALSLLKQVAQPWSLAEPLAETALSWAARLHEIGLDVSHSQYQKHGAYLLAHADMPGFPREEQALLASLVGAHRRKIVVMTEDLIPPWNQKAHLLVLILRLAVLLHRGHGSDPLPSIRLSAKPRSLTVQFPRGWLKANPLTVADLRQEVDYWKAAAYRLRVFENKP